MEKLLLFLVPLITTISSIVSAEYDTNTSRLAPPSTTVSSTNSTILIEEFQNQTSSSNFSSEYVDAVSNQTSLNVSTSTAPLSSGNTGSTNESSFSSLSTTSGLSLSSRSFMRSTATTPKSYTDTTLLTVAVSVSPNASTPVFSNINMSEETVAPSQSPESGLTLLAFGVMSLILVLIIVMVILVAAVNLKGRCCKNTKQLEGRRNCDSMVSESNMTSNDEKESITLVSVRTINTDNNTDSPQISSVNSTIVDNEDQDVSRDLLISLGS